MTLSNIFSMFINILALISTWEIFYFMVAAALLLGCVSLFTLGLFHYGKDDK